MLAAWESGPPGGVKANKKWRSEGGRDVLELKGTKGLPQTWAEIPVGVKWKRSGGIRKARLSKMYARGAQFVLDCVIVA